MPLLPVLQTAQAFLGSRRFQFFRMPQIGVAIRVFICGWPILLLSCNSFSLQSSIQFIQNNSQRIIENKKVHADLKEADRAILLSYFQDPNQGNENFRLAVIHILERSNASLQLAYFDLLTFAIQDPSTEIQSRAEKIFMQQTKTTAWENRALQYLPLPTSTGQIGKPQVPNPAAPSPIGLLKTARMLELDLSPEQVAYLVSAYHSAEKSWPYLAQYLVDTYPLQNFSLLVPNLEETKKTQSQENTDEQGGGAAILQERKSLSFYRALRSGDPLERTLLLQVYQVFAMQLRDQTKGTKPPIREMDKVRAQNEDLLQSTFSLVLDPDYRVRQGAAQVLEAWPIQALNGGPEELVSSFLVRQLDQHAGLKNHEIRLVFSILSQYNSVAYLEKILALYYQKDLSIEQGSVYLQFFQQHKARFSEVYIDTLRQNYLAVPDKANSQKEPPNNFKKILYLFEQLNDDLKLSILEIYFSLEMDTNINYQKIFAPFLLQSIYLGSAINASLQNFFSRSVYDLFYNYRNIAIIFQKFTPHSISGMEQISKTSPNFLIIQENLEIFLQIISDEVLFSLINWDSLSYFRESEAQKLWQRYDIGGEETNDTNRSREFGDTNLLYLLHEKRQAIKALRIYPNMGLEQTAENQWFLNWLKIYTIMLYRGVRDPGQWPQWLVSLKENEIPQAAVPQASSKNRPGENQSAAVPSTQSVSQSSLHPPSLLRVNLVWRRLLEKYKDRFGPGQRAVLRTEKEILLAANLMRNFRLWQAWPVYLQATYNAAFITYTDYIQGILRLNKETKSLQIAIQNRFLKSEIVDPSMLNLQENMVNIEGQRLRLQRQFLQRRAALQATVYRQAFNLWQQHFENTKNLNDEWKFSGTITKMWFQFLFQDFQVQDLEQLVHFVRHNSLLSQIGNK